VGEIQAYRRKTIPRPVSGILDPPGEPGSTSRVGDPIVPLHPLDPIYVNLLRPAAGGRDAARRNRSGDQARGNGRHQVPRRVTAINTVVDEATRNMQGAGHPRESGGPDSGRAGSEGPDGARSGCPAVSPRLGISYAPYGDSVLSSRI